MIMMNKYENKARLLHKAGFNCSNSLYNAFKDELKLGNNMPQPRSVDGLCGAVIAVEYILKYLGKEEFIEEYRNLFIKEFGYLKCADLLKNGRMCNDYVGFSASYISTKII